MARRAQPAAVKKAKGNPGRRKIVDAPAPASAAPPAPGRFPCPPRFKGVKRELWKKVVEPLAAMNFLRSSDLPALERYVALLAKWRLAEQLLEKSKLVQVTSSEHVQDLERTSKALMVAIMIDKRLSEIEDRFGMNPAARQGLLLKMVAAANQPQLPLGGAAPAKEPAAPPPESPIGLLNRPEGHA